MARLPLIVIALATLFAAGCDGNARTPVASTSVATTELRFDVEGMTCDGCVQFIESRIGRIDGVAGCEVSLDEGSAVVLARDESVAPAILESLASTPYRVRPQGPALALAFRVEGVECARCVEFVTQRVAGLDGVRDIELHQATGSLRVAANEPAVADRIVAALADTAYRATVEP
jgi:Cu+-exporting ATPase